MRACNFASHARCRNCCNVTISLTLHGIFEHTHKLWKTRDVTGEDEPALGTPTVTTSPTIGISLPSTCPRRTWPIQLCMDGRRYVRKSGEGALVRHAWVFFLFFPSLHLVVGLLNRPRGRGSVERSRSAVWSWAGPHPKLNLLHFSLKIWHLMAKILIIFQRTHWLNFAKIAAINITLWACGSEWNRFSQSGMPVLLLISNVNRCVWQHDTAKTKRLPPKSGGGGTTPGVVGDMSPCPPTDLRSCTCRIRTTTTNNEVQGSHAVAFLYSLVTILFSMRRIF